MVVPFQRSSDLIEQGRNGFPVEVNVKSINFEGKSAYLEVARDISERKRSENVLRHRIELEKMVSQISTHFINLPSQDVDKAIFESLKNIGSYCDVDRSYVFLISENGLDMSNSHEWCGAGIDPQMNNLQSILISILPWWMAKLKNFDFLAIHEVSELPLEASVEKEILESQSIRSVLVVPMAFQQRLIGFLGFDSVRNMKMWSDEDAGMLKAIGEVFVNAIERRNRANQIKLLVG